MDQAGDFSPDWFPAPSWAGDIQRTVDNAGDGLVDGIGFDPPPLPQPQGYRMSSSELRCIVMYQPEHRHLRPAASVFINRSALLSSG